MIHILGRDDAVLQPPGSGRRHVVGILGRENIRTVSSTVRGTERYCESSTFII